MSIDQLYQEEFQALQPDVAKKAAMAALARHHNLGVTVGEFFSEITDTETWEWIEKLTLLEFIQALSSHEGTSDSVNDFNGGLGKYRLHKIVVNVLRRNPGSGMAVLSQLIGASRQKLAAVLRQLRREGKVITNGERAAMVYFLADGAVSDEADTSA